MVDADIFAQQAVDITVQGMIGVGAEHFFVAAGFCVEQSGMFEAVEFDPDGVGGFAKLALEVTQIAGSVGVQEELQQQFKACFGSDKGVEHWMLVTAPPGHSHRKYRELEQKTI